MPREQARSAANQCVEVLRKNPDDIAAREKFARLLAESLDETDDGIEQLELLIAMGGQQPAKRAEWLILVAGWHARLRDNVDAARLVYQEVMRDFPETPHASEAQRRLNLLNLQARFRQRSGARAAV